MKTWAEVVAARNKFLASIASVVAEGHATDGWCKGAGIGFDVMRGYVLAVRVRDDKDILTAHNLARAIGWDGLTDIQAVGTITTL